MPRRTYLGEEDHGPTGLRVGGAVALVGKKPLTPEQRERRRAAPSTASIASPMTNASAKTAREQRRADNVRWYETHREQVLARGKLYYEENRERINQERKKRRSVQTESKRKAE
jgi:hypothetical protein